MRTRIVIAAVLIAGVCWGAEGPAGNPMENHVDKMDRAQLRREVLFWRMNFMAECARRTHFIAVIPDDALKQLKVRLDCQSKAGVYLVKPEVIIAEAKKRGFTQEEIEAFKFSDHYRQRSEQGLEACSPKDMYDYLSGAAMFNGK